MNKKLTLYSFTGLLAGSVAMLMLAATQALPQAAIPNTITDITKTARTQSRSISQAIPPDNTTPVPSRSRMMGQSERHFIVMMIPHHEGAVAMADLALSRAKHPELKKLAVAIKTTQNKEIQQMQTWYKQWYGTDVPAWRQGMGWGWHHRDRQQQGNTQPGWNSGMGMHQGWNDRGWGSGGGCCMMGGGWMGTNMYALQNASDFDREFIQQMIPHHQMGVMMAQMVLTHSQRSEIRQLAEAIVKSQTAEIDQMQQWYQKWYQTS
ncbi:DUF305 domain-containing protein [Chroococcidiopsis sp. CCNUC1]|uniref:DUF305 domain-containing protein n=1 Tax=Chroococcidiopsis sp. CCNUC1 TaxID=2653189 RepID=UPI002021DBCE|nr:DUF305 domain-containing protein [Chroococcidiopsis sp. CCNUC1]URD53366.1 DUF305 domain-containing protein [Chroococcidiopsis sp. CCNUC1]